MGSFDVSGESYSNRWSTHAFPGVGLTLLGPWGLEGVSNMPFRATLIPVCFQVSVGNVL